MRSTKFKIVISLLLAAVFALSAAMPCFAQEYDDLNHGTVIIENDISTAVALQRFNAVRNRFYTNTEVADKVTMIGESKTVYVFNTPSYALLAARMLTALSDGDTEKMYTYEFVPYRNTGYSEDTFKAPVVSKEMYLDMAKQILKYYETNGRCDFDVLTYPNETVTEYSGNICMYRAAGILSWALAYYYQNGVLPEYITTAYKRNERVAIELKEESYYVLDYSTDYLKNVGSGTSIADFLKNFTTTDLYIADATGERINDTSEIIKTGWFVCRENETRILDSIVIIVNGDLNCDGLSNNADTEIMVDAIMNGTEFIGLEKAAIDTDLNKRINIKDLLSLQRSVNSIKNKNVTYTFTAAENAFNFVMSERAVQNGEEFTLKIYASPYFKARSIGALDFSVRIDPERIEIVSFTVPENRSKNTVSATSYSEETKELRLIWSDATAPISKIDYLMEIKFKAKQDIAEIWPSANMPVYFVINKSFMTDIYGNEFEFRAAKRYADEMTEEVVETPAPDAVFSLDHAAQILGEAGKEYEKTGTVPETLTFGETVANKASYFRLACEVLSNLIDVNEDDVPYYVCSEPQNASRDTMSDDTMSKTAYAYIVRKQLEAMNTLVDGEYSNVPAPFIAIGQTYGINGRMDYERTLITFMRIFAYYNDFGVLPENIDIAWEDKTYVLASDIIDSARTVMDHFDANYKMPNSVKVGEKTLNMSQYFDVASKMILEINDTGIAHKIFLQDCTELGWVANDDLIIENANNLMSKEAYLHFIETQMAAMDAYARRQPLMTVSFEEFDGMSGTANFDHQILMLARILRSYRKTGVLPESVAADYAQETTVYEIPSSAALTACRTLYEAYDKDIYANLPTSKTVTFKDDNGEEVTLVLKQATYAQMAAELLTALWWDEMRLPEKIYVRDVQNPVQNIKDDTFADETIGKNDYLKLARAYSAYTEGHANKAPSLLLVDGLDGTMCFDRVTVIMLRALAEYAQKRMLSTDVFTVYESSALPPVQTSEPTAAATVEPTATATVEPTAAATVEPTAVPSVEPTAVPSIEPTAVPEEIEFVQDCPYTKDENRNVLLGVEENTTLKDLLSQFENPEYIKVFDASDKEITDTDAVIGTGCKVKLLEGVTLKEELNIAIVGDVNGDGKINSRDIAQIQKILLGVHETSELQEIAADLREDEKINSRDIAALQRVLLV